MKRKFFDLLEQARVSYCVLNESSVMLSGSNKIPIILTKHQEVLLKVTGSRRIRGNIYESDSSQYMLIPKGGDLFEDKFESDLLGIRRKLPNGAWVPSEKNTYLLTLFKAMKALEGAGEKTSGITKEDRVVITSNLEKSMGNLSERKYTKEYISILSMDRVIEKKKENDEVFFQS